MDRIARSSRQDRAELFRLTADRLRFHPVNVEKDFWVCWLLKQLFSMQELNGWLVFKGGTSLSKCFNLIQRFSEDIDLAVDFEKLGFTGDRDPRQSSLSHTKRQPILESMLEACRGYVAGAFLSALRSRIDGILGGSGWALSVSAYDPNAVEFTYPPALDLRLDYIRPSVVLELGTHAEPIPRERVWVRPYAAELFPPLFGEPACSVTTVVARRTFWEKATILHAEYHRPLEKRMLPRYSRHYSDVAAMVRAPVCSEAMADLELLQSVVTHKDRFYHAAWARVHEARKGTFRLVPRDERTPEIRRDHQAMVPMFFGDPPEFDKILQDLGDFERRINA